MLGVVRGALRGAPTSTLVAAWGAHNLAFMLFAVIALARGRHGVSGRAGDGSGGRVAGFATDRRCWPARSWWRSLSRSPSAVPGGVAGSRTSGDR